MTEFIIKKLPCDLTANAGLALAGQYTKHLGINVLVDSKFPVAVGGIPNSDILKFYLGLLVQGKNDFDANEEFRGNAFFIRGLDVSTFHLQAPSPRTLERWVLQPVHCVGLLDSPVLWVASDLAPEKRPPWLI